MNRPHFRRHPRPVDPNPEYSRLDQLDGLGTRYDSQWPDVLAAEGGLALGRALDLADLPADQSGFSGWGEGYEIERDYSARYAAAAASPEPFWPVEPHGRHRQTDPLDLILADLRDIEDRLA